MKTIPYTKLLLLNIALLLVSCNNTNKTANANDEIITDTAKVVVSDTLNKFSDPVTGIYKAERINADMDACAISIEISGSEGNYKYLLKSQRQDVNGDLLVEKSTVPGEHNLMLQGLKYDMRDGDVSTGKASATAPTQVPATLKENAIMIENTGDKLNSFTVFNDCAGKYIKLVKQKDL